MSCVNKEDEPTICQKGCKFPSLAQRLIQAFEQSDP